MIDSNYKKRDSEQDIDYIYRMCTNREVYDLTWEALAVILNEELGSQRSESYYRKNYKNGQFRHLYETTVPKKQYFDERIQEAIDVSIPTEEDAQRLTMEELLFTIKKERVKLRDERTQLNANVRKIAREEDIKEIAYECASRVEDRKLLRQLYSFNEVREGSKSAILELSDWHYGIDVNSYWNTYNPDIAKYRISKLRDEVIRYLDFHNVNDLWVVNLADLICGRIHLTLRLQSRIDVITQIMEVSEILSEFLNDLRSTGCRVHYVSCLDNHSRIEPNKGDSLDFESLTRITDWYLTKRLEGIVDFHENTYSQDIITFEVGGYKIAGIHGDKDKPSEVVKHITMMTHSHYDLILTAHLHHFSCDEQNETVVISNGSLMGTDDYAEKLRLSSKPSQNLIIVSDKSVCEAIHRIILD